jgi:phosphomannomutase
VIVQVPEEQRDIYQGKDYTLLPADDLWALLMWYRFKFDKKINLDESFIVLSHTTTDALIKLSKKYRVGVIKTWVGFAALSAGVRDAWNGDLVSGLVEGRKDPASELCDPFILETIDMHENRSYNIGAMEQSNGFSLLGSPPLDKFSLGVNGHVRDKDGTFAAVLVAEVAEWAKQQGTTLFELIDNEIYLDPAVGLFVNYYEADPLDGEYPGIEGDKTKIAILRRVLGLYQFALAGGLEIAGVPVKSAVIYRTGKYDRVYPPTSDFQFPDEGVRFYFDEERLSHLLIRPSGTTNSLRFHVQLEGAVNADNLIHTKKELRQRARKIVDHLRELLKAPRSSDIE